MSATDTNSGKVIAATVVGMILPTIAVAGRVWARRMKAVELYLDDYLIMLALLFKFGIDIAGCCLIEHGLGRHISTVSAHDMVIFLQIQYTGAILYPFCVTFTKLSICYQYKRLFTGRFFSYVVDTLIVITILWCVSVCFTGVFICTPIDKSWRPMKPGHCINLVSFYYGLQIPNVFTDFAILVLPLKEVFELKLPKQQKVGVAFTCALWLLCLVFGIVRLVVMLQLESKGPDVTYTLADAAVWTTVEPTVAVTTACLPAVRVLYRTFVDFCKGKKDESQRLQSLSDSSAMRHGQTLVERPSTPRSMLNYKDCVKEEDAYGETLKTYSSAVQSPVSPTSPATTKYARSEDV